MSHPTCSTPSTLDSIISSRLEELDLSVSDFAARCRLDLRVATALIDGHTKIHASQVEPIAKALHMSPAFLMRVLVADYMPEVDAVLSVTPAHASPVSGDLTYTPHHGLSLITVIGPDGRQVVRERAQFRLPTLRLRQMLIHVPDRFTARDAAPHLFVSEPEAAWLLPQLAEVGLVQLDSNRDASNLWRATGEGRQLMEAQVPRPLKRRKALSIVDRFLVEVSALNADHNLAYRVTGVNLIGELLTSADEVPHVELTVVLADRHHDREGCEAVRAGCEARLADRLRGHGVHADPKTLRARVSDFARSEVQDRLRDCGVPVCLRWVYDARDF